MEDEATRQEILGHIYDVFERYGMNAGPRTAMAILGMGIGAMAALGATRALLHEMVDQAMGELPEDECASQTETN